MNNKAYRTRLYWLTGLTILSFLVTLCLATSDESVWASVLLAVISGGLISVLLTLMVQKLADDAETDDIRRALISDLALNIRWARYNRLPLSDSQFSVWVPLRIDSFLIALSHQNRLELPAPALESILEATDRIHAFNQDVATYNHTANWGQSAVRIELRDAMKKHAIELYEEYLLNIVLALSSDAEPARRSYEEDWDSLIVKRKG